jgi:hypothetical protein
MFDDTDLINTQVCKMIMENSSEWKMFIDDNSSSVFIRKSPIWLSIESPRTLIQKVYKLKL